MLLHDIDSPNIFHGNALERNVREYKESEKFDIVLMNPPYGGTESEGVKINFPADLRSSETADLFISVIMYRLKDNWASSRNHPRWLLIWNRQCKGCHQEETA